MRVRTPALNFNEGCGAFFKVSGAFYARMWANELGGGGVLFLGVFLKLWVEPGYNQEL